MIVLFKNVDSVYGVIAGVLLLILVSIILKNGWNFQTILKQGGETSVSLIDALKA